MKKYNLVKIIFIFSLIFIFSCTSNKNIKEQIRLSDTKGPYYLEKYPVIKNSESLYIITYHLTENKPIKENKLKLNDDYTLDYEKGVINFTKTPVAYDKAGNPNYISIFYDKKELFSF
ncbi:MAG: hypothetical protein U0457_12515 [Candidatus Sericytochromatia bacterium]